MDFQQADIELRKYHAFNSYISRVLFDRNDKSEKCFEKIWREPNTKPDEILKEIKKMLEERNMPWEAIAITANIQASSEEETRAWLQKMIDIIEANRPAPKKPTNALLKKLGFGKDALENPNDKK